MLKGEVEFDAANEESSAFDTAKPWLGAPPDVVYNAGVPPELFDFIIIDECQPGSAMSRSTYLLAR